MNHRSRLAVGIPVGLALIAAGLPSRTRAQEPRCSHPDFRPVRAAELGSASSPVALTAILARTRDGYYLADLFLGSEITVLSAEGEIMGNIGREGAGPREFRAIRAIRADAADSLHVFDSRNRRLVVISPDRAFARTDPVPVTVTSENGVLLLGEEGYLVNGVSPHQQGRALHHLRPTGEPVRSFSHPGSESPGSVVVLGRATGPRRFWTAAHRDLRLDLWDLEGRILRTLRPDLDGWVPGSAPVVARRGRPPANSSAITGLVQVYDEVVVIVGRHPDAEWRSALGPEGTIEDFSRLHDVFLSFIEADDGTLLGTCTFDQGIGGLLDDQRMFTFQETAPGEGVIQVWKLSIRGGEP